MEANTTKTSIRSNKPMYDVGEQGLMSVRDYWAAHQARVDEAAREWTEDQEGFDEWATIQWEEAAQRLALNIVAVTVYQPRNDHDDLLEACKYLLEEIARRDTLDAVMTSARVKAREARAEDTRKE